MIIWVGMGRERDFRDDQGGYLVPPVDHLCPVTGKTKGGKHRLQRVKGVGKSRWRVAWSTSKVTGLGTARALR